MTFPQVLTNPAQANWPLVVNANGDATKAVAIFGKKDSVTSGLTWGYYGGTMLVDGVLTTIADSTVALTGNSTNYVEATRAGVVSANTTGFTAGRAPLYTLVCSASAVTSETDGRAWVQPAGIDGRLSLSVAGSSNVTLTAAQARNDILNFTGLLTGSINVIVPDGPQIWTVTNNTTGAFSVTVKTSAGTGIAVTQGKSLDVAADGTNVIATNNDTAGAGAGDVVGPASSTNSNFALFDGASGKLLKDTGVSVASIQASIDAAVAGLSWKQAVRAATTAALTLASDFENGDTLDGVVLATGDRILLKNQAAPAENGIRIVAASGAPARATDANSSAELVNASVYVSEGTTNADTQWTCTTNAPITVDTTALAFAQLTSGGTSVATDTIWDAAGDLVQGTGANTAARLPIGAAHQIPRANSGATANAYTNDTLTDSPAFSATPTLDTTGAEVIYFGALTANVTAFNLSGTRPKVIVCFVQDATGGRTVAAGSSIDFGADIPDLSGIRSTLSTYTYVGFVYNPTTTKFRVVALSK